MKRIFCSVAAGLLALATSAQSGHIEFQGEPLTGTLSNFAERMEDHGYDIRHIERGNACMRGEYEGYKGCWITFSTNMDTGFMVNRVYVSLPFRLTWSEVESDYNIIKSKLEARYGKPTRVTERVKKSCIKDDIVRNMHSSELNYSAIFESADGTVEVFMELVGGIVLAEERLRVVVVYND